jgi:surfactin synthase thioesterase subunit/glycosyltransferase involved in cell wall biosynthesis
MRILLAHNSRYFPAHGGGDKSNRLLMEALADRGHACRVVARLSAFNPREHELFLERLAARSIPVTSSDSGVVVFTQGGVEVHVLTSNPRLRACFAAQIAEFAPTAILNSTDDPAQVLLGAALRAEALRDEFPRVVYLARATLALPFGPDCAFPSAAKTSLLRQADGVVAVSRYVASYVQRWSGIEAVPLPISLLEPGPYPELGRFENEFVTLVNPCAVKGISIFLALAAQMPEVRFAAVPTWGTNRKDRAALAALPNVRILDPVDDIDDVLKRTRVLLVPSLWNEARSRIVVEAMLRGVPVLASNLGGIPEAKLGVPYLISVRPIERFCTELDEQMVPMAEVPEQETGAWAGALAKLLRDPAHYAELSRASREAALAYASQLSVGPFETYLHEVVRAPRRPRVPDAAPEPQPLDQLSPEKRRLLALRLRKKSPDSSAWFPDVDSGRAAQLRLFLFPHAGAGASTFRRWPEALPAGVALFPARLPGRESRISEPPFESMAPLIEALGQAIEPYLTGPFAFYGHSMGAAVAFELARHLRRRNLPAPASLFVSGARAPQFRLHHVPHPEPSHTQLLDELRRLGGILEHALESQEWTRVILPALRADSTLYRNYVYLDEPPLDCAIRAYGGAEDRHVTPAHLEAWRQQTTASFAFEVLPGGHFFVQSPQFLATLARDLWV